jgi:hypothetical protein
MAFQFPDGVADLKLVQYVNSSNSPTLEDIKFYRQKASKTKSLSEDRKSFDNSNTKSWGQILLYLYILIVL